MSDDKDKLSEAVLKILMLTHQGALLWEKESPPEVMTRSTDSAIAVYFETNYGKRRLALYRERVPLEPRHMTMDALSAFLSAKPDVAKWQERDRLALLHNDGTIAYEFPPSREVRDLFESVRYKTSGLDQFLNDLLNIEPSKA